MKKTIFWMTTASQEKVPQKYWFYFFLTEKRILVTVWLLKTLTYHKAVFRLCASRCSVPDAKYQLLKLRHAQKTKFLSLFLTSFSSFAGHLLSFTSVEKVFEKALIIFGSQGSAYYKYMCSYSRTCIKWSPAGNG